LAAFFLPVRRVTAAVLFPISFGYNDFAAGGLLSFSAKSIAADVIGVASVPQCVWIGRREAISVMIRKSVFFGIWLATYVLLILPFFVVESLRVWRSTGDGRAFFLLWLFSSYGISNSLAPKFYSLLGLSLARQTFVPIDISPAQETETVPESVEIRKPEPLGSGAYVPAVLFGLIGLFPLFSPSLGDKFAALGSYAMAAVCIVIARLGIDKPAVLATGDGIRSFRDSGNLWPKSVRWEQVARCDIVTSCTLWGEAESYLSLKNARGRQMLTADIKESTPEERDRLIRLIRQRDRWRGACLSLHDECGIVSSGSEPVQEG
jgi:hypothetical protein